MRGTRTTRRGSRIDRAMLALVRLVHDDRWTDLDAAAELRRQGHHEEALALARARVISALADRPSVYGDRAVAILDAALDSTEGRGSR